MANNRLEAGLVRVLRCVVGSLVILAVLINFANVVGRYVFFKPFVWAEEVMQFMNVWAVLLGGAVVACHGSHLKMDVFSRMGSPRLRRLLDALTNLLAIAVSLYVIYQSLQMIRMLEATGQRSVIARIPMDLMYAVIPV
ncbi:MAG TPA: TRAP transporter small permease, partial [Candidatus Methylomirabilis sp.]